MRLNNFKLNKLTPRNNQSRLRSKFKIFWNLLSKCYNFKNSSHNLTLENSILQVLIARSSKMLFPKAVG